MKKNLSLTMALAMLGTALTGCGSKDAAAQTPAENTQQTAPVQQEQSQTEKALALINTFATGDTYAARSLLDDGYIQHNLAYGTGADAFIGSVEYLASADVKTTVNNIRAFEDGDKVFMQTIYNFAGAGEQDVYKRQEVGGERGAAFVIFSALYPRQKLQRAFAAEIVQNRFRIRGKLIRMM